VNAAAPSAIVLAAGLSSRMRELKPLLPLDGLPAVVRVAGAYRAVGLEPVVVLGRGVELVAPVLERHGVSYVVSGAPAGLAAALPELAATWGRSTRVERAGGGTIAVLPASADKGDGLRLVATHLAVPLSRVVACGDSSADESLLRTAGFSIAVGDPPDAALAGADEPVTQKDRAQVLRRRLEPLLRLS
jgi:hydroxymethylpyrimidine pyrophosphatase-like HAD family hydrolase